MQVYRLKYPCISFIIVSDLKCNVLYSVTAELNNVASDSRDELME